MSLRYRTLLATLKDVDDRFTMIVKSDNAGTSATNQFTIPTTGGGYLYDVSTSDGHLATNITGNHTITFPSGAGTHTVFIKGNFPRIHFNQGGDRLKLLEVTNWGVYGLNQTNQSAAFRGCANLSQIADKGAWFNVVTNGFRMFMSCVQLTSLPSGMNLPLLTEGTQMFFSGSLTSLPSGMTLPLLSLASDMFRGCNLTSLPSGMNLPLLTNGAQMFSFNSLTSLPSGMNLPLLTNGDGLFRLCSLTDLPSGMTLPLLSTAVNMFVGCAINTPRYSQLLIDLESGNSNNSVTFSGGNSRFNLSGQIARNILTTAPRNWTITDLGLQL